MARKGRGKFILRIAFGNQAVLWAEENALKFNTLKRNKSIRNGDGMVLVLHFNTAEERTAYLKGVADMDGWSIYSAEESDEEQELKHTKRLYGTEPEQD